MPVHARFCKRRDDVNRVVFSRSVDQKRDQVVLEQSFGQLDLFPEPTQSGLVPQKKEYLLANSLMADLPLRFWTPMLNTPSGC